MNFVFDTSALLHMLKNSPRYQQFEANWKPFDPGNIALLSIVSQAEIRSLGERRGWGANTWSTLAQIMQQFVIVPIHSHQLLDAYVDIDVWSMHKSKNRPYPSGYTSRTMGKNDLWIAALSFSGKANLITHDGDFRHLNPTFINVIYL